MLTALPLCLFRVETFPTSWCERWQKGPASARRVQRLRRELGRGVASRTVEISHRWTAELGGDRVTIICTEITYIARADVAARLAA